MDTSRKRSWDVAPLILVGVMVGLVGPLLAGAGSAAAAALSLGGLVLLVTALLRWSRRTRECTPRTARQLSATDPVSGVA